MRCKEQKTDIKQKTKDISVLLRPICQLACCRRVKFSTLQIFIGLCLRILAKMFIILHYSHVTIKVLGNYSCIMHCAIT